MHLGRFNLTVFYLSEYFSPKPLLNDFDVLLQALQAYSSAPTTEGTTNFRNSIDKLYATLDSLGELPSHPSFEQIAHELGADEFSGSAIRNAIESIGTAKSMVPSELLTELKVYRKKLDTFVNKIAQLNTALASFDLEGVWLDEDQFEFGALLPRELVGNRASDLVSELQHIHRLFSALNEITGNGTASPKVRTISSSWWQFFLDVDTVQISAAVFAIERIVALYKSNLEIKKLKQDLDKKDMGPEIATLLEQKIEEKLRSGLKEIAIEIRKQFGKLDDEARTNELENQIRIELLHVAKRINQGAIYEARAGEPKKPKDLNEEETVDAALIEKHADALLQYQKKLDFVAQVNRVGSSIKSDISSNAIGTQLLIDYDKD